MLVHKIKRFFSPPFKGLNEEQSIILAKNGNILLEKFRNGEDANEYTIMMFIMQKLLLKNYEFDLDFLIEFVKPLYQERKDKIKEYHNIDAEIYLVEDAVNMYIKHTINEA